MLWHGHGEYRIWIYGFCLYFELKYGRMVDFSRIIDTWSLCIWHCMQPLFEALVSGFWSTLKVMYDLWDNFKTNMVLIVAFDCSTITNIPQHSFRNLTRFWLNILTKLHLPLAATCRASLARQRTITVYRSGRHVDTWMKGLKHYELFEYITTSSSF